ncbi:MAG: phosphate ABC transporter permease subunit PstC [Alphaproteobacteria bacterium]|nr:phosphate ABC transporter permease subunit PstC [Alphaproteobacteria bacterium]MDE1967265.1 phosphate ABC transporter permease subunit PstC [Alphaproteobacteria bacterium]
MWRQRLGDTLFRGLTQAFAIGVLVLLGAVLVALAAGAMPAFRKFGFDFLVSETWNPVKETFGALPAIYGTVLTALIAMLIAVPVAVGIAIFLTELCPPVLRRPIGMLVELLAAIPSIIYGVWGLLVVAPVLQTTLQPFLIDTLGDIPVVGVLFQGPPYGLGMLTAGLILAVMVLPFIAAVIRDVFMTVPAMLRESAYGMGATTAEVVRSIVIPHSRVGIVGGVMLGLGRALGETMAVTFVIGNAHHIRASLLAPGTTISATLANEFTEAVSDTYTSSLIALGLILFVITFIVLAIANFMLWRLSAKEGA